MPKVSPVILRWARESAGFSIEQAAVKIGLNEARGVSAADRLHSMELDATEISRPLLLRIAKAYRRPLLTFYLSEPPRHGDRGEDFRTLPDREPGTEPFVDALLRDVRARQLIVRSLLEDDEDARLLPFIGSKSVEDGVGSVLASIRQTLKVDLVEFRSQRSSEGAFAYLRSRAEAAGIFVLLIGNLGSHHTDLPVETFRGFALADPIAPFVVINDKDAKAAWSFTLLHEVAHLWIGASGISGASTETRIEKFSNDVASAFLLPDYELAEMQINNRSDISDLRETISNFANERLLSRSLVTYRLWRTGKISENGWRTLSQTFRDEWRTGRVQQRERSRDQEGGPNFYVVRRHRLGSALIGLVARSLDDGSLTPTKAGKVLGVRPRNVVHLIEGAVA